MPSTAAPTSLGRRQLIAAGSLAMVGVAARTALAQLNVEISRMEESIHQERIFRAARKRVYDALTIERQFDRIVLLSGVMKDPALAKMQTPTKLSPRVGDEFALFGGYIIGRALELQTEERIVQAWRVLSWPKGVYSIARFELLQQSDATKVIFDHTGFPKGEAEHLAAGWQQHYWDPLTQFLA